MTYSDLSKTMRLWIGAREAFRRLGFSSDDLYLRIAGSARFGGVVSAFVTLRAQGKEFDLECGPVGSADAFEQQYTTVCEAMNSGNFPEEDLERIWRESEPCQDSVGFVTAVVRKGFFVPKVMS